MAKVGNEAKLILRLAKEKSDREKEGVTQILEKGQPTEFGKHYLQGKVQGLRQYETILWDIIREMERG